MTQIIKALEDSFVSTIYILHENNIMNKNTDSKMWALNKLYRELLRKNLWDDNYLL